MKKLFVVVDYSKAFDTEWHNNVWKLWYNGTEREIQTVLIWCTTEYPHNFTFVFTLHLWLNDPNM